jgi:hypothetical protein
MREATRKIGILPAKPMDVTRILPAKTSIFEQQKWRLMAGTMVISPISGVHVGLSQVTRFL